MGKEKLYNTLLGKVNELINRIDKYSINMCVNNKFTEETDKWEICLNAKDGKMTDGIVYLFKDDLRYHFNITPDNFEKELEDGVSYFIEKFSDAEEYRELKKTITEFVRKEMGNIAKRYFDLGVGIPEDLSSDYEMTWLFVRGLLGYPFSREEFEEIYSKENFTMLVNSKYHKLTK